MMYASPSALLSSASAEWYTPPDLAREIAAFLGGIDLDPCAEEARAIPARRHETARGLEISWTGRVYVNPPYGREIGRWVEKALTEPVEELILLVPARTDTRWFQALWPHAICFLRGRLHFSGSAVGAPFPSALIYRGRRPAAFRSAFAHRGHTALET